MPRILALLLLTLLPNAAFALCEGQDLIDAMPEADRAALQAEADAMPYPRGIYWQATRGDQTITMFGTYHFRHEQTDSHLSLIKPRIDQADAVYLEMSNEETDLLEAQVASDPSLMFITEGPTLPDLLSEENWARLRSEMGERGYPAFLVAKMKPIWAAMLLGIGPCETRNAVAGAEGIDRLIGTYSEAQGTPSRSLENGAELFEILDSDPIEKQVGFINVWINVPLDADDMSFTMRQRYLDEEVALLWQYGIKLALEFGGPTAVEDMAKFEDVLLRKRNQAWVDLLLKREEKEIFAAFGAAHLPGTFGVLYLLEQEGYEITRQSVPQ